MPSNNSLVAEYLKGLLEIWLQLDSEKQVLESPAARLAEITAEQAALVSSAQEALNRYNTLNATNYTLAQIRAKFFPT